MKTVQLSMVLAATLIGFAVDSAQSLRDFSAAYNQAKGEREKLLVCIDAIDAGVIRFGASRDDLKKIFGDDFTEQGAESRGDKLAIVHFVPPRRSTNALGSDFPRGWHLGITYTPDGVVTKYSLSNLSKEVKMPPDEAKTGVDTGLPPVKP